MQRALSSSSAPSSSLLRFLRTKIEEPAFFSSATATPTDLCSGYYSCSSKENPGSAPKDGGPCPNVRARKQHRPFEFPAQNSVKHRQVVTHHSNLLGGWSTTKCPRPCNGQRWPFQSSGNPLQHVFKRSIWKRNGGRRSDAEAKARELPPLPSFLDETTGTTLGRTKAAKPGSELKLRCTEIDENGNVITVNGEFKKSELIAKYGLLPRDLRKIDSSLLPHILVRPSAILINLLHLRVLIKHNCVLVLDTYGSTDSFAQSQFMYDLSGKLSQKDSRQAGNLPYEFRALEAVLISVTTGLEGEFDVVSEPVVRVLRELEEDIDRDKLRHLLIYSKRLGTFEQKARLVRDAIDDLLEADDDLVTMYLTERAQGKVREEDDHTEVEMLLESYHKVCDEIVQISGNLVSNIRNTEEIIRAILDANRNSLIMLDLKFSIGTLGIGSGAFVASLYGMNLKNFIEESDFGFLGVSGGSFLFALAVCAYGLKKLSKVQRVSMWGERGRGQRGSWRDVSSPRMSRIEEEARKERADRLKKLSGTSNPSEFGDRRNAAALPPVVRTTS